MRACLTEEKFRSEPKSIAVIEFSPNFIVSTKAPHLRFFDDLAFGSVGVSGVDDTDSIRLGALNVCYSSPENAFSPTPSITG